MDTVNQSTIEHALNTRLAQISERFSNIYIKGCEVDDVTRQLFVINTQNGIAHLCEVFPEIKSIQVFDKSDPKSISTVKCSVECELSYGNTISILSVESSIQ